MDPAEWEARGKIDTDDRKLDDAPGEVNRAAFVIHAATHGSSPGDLLIAGEREWPALMRQLDRADPSYRH
jgi:hypothetical protein